ncbi:MAG: hypothetical protein ACTHM1_11515 [Solirubrobacteraceae bacterium]
MISVVSIWAITAVLAADVEATPLKITKFTMATTKAVKVPVTSESFGFANEPEPFTQAGGHPDSLTTVIEFETENVNTGEAVEPQRKVPTRDPKDILVDLPAGLLGNPTATPRCRLVQVVNRSTLGKCPASTQVGIAVFHLNHGEGLEGPIVNVTPEAGQSAEFGFETNHELTFLATGHVVHNGAGYGLSVDTNGIPMTELTGVETTFWGTPADPSHDPERGLLCFRINPPSEPWRCNVGETQTGGEPSTIPPVPFLTMPADCAADSETATVHADSWQEPGQFESATVTTSLPGPTGCDLLQFEPEINVKPDTFLADEPVGLGVDLTVPQVEKQGVSATPELRDATVTLPLGMSVSPGIVDGIRACEATGPEGIDIPTGTNAIGEPLNPGEVGEGEERGVNGEPVLAPGHCPDASKVGTAEATSPLLPEPVKGSVFLARPGCGGAGQSPCTEQDVSDGNLYKLYLELGGRGALANSGVNVKVRLNTHVDPATGQLTAVATENAELPFSELKIHLNGGPRAALDNPASCGPATTTAHFTSWSASGVTPEGVFMPGVPDVTSSPFFNVEGCATSAPLHPTFLAGTVSPDAAQFSAFTLNIGRQDREQYVKGVQVHTPPGLLGMLSHVPLCRETEANAGSCPEASKIGTTRVASGAGSHPFEVEGDMYLTGPHDGSPFGLSVVTNVVAGPFNLGKVVVRGRIDVDRHDSSLTVTTDESGPYALPQIVFGVPLRLQRISVNVDRSGFMFNPTNCKTQQITASISGTQGAVSTVSSPFTAARCRILQFKPKFSVSTNGHTSRKLGASLDAKLSYPKGAMGSDANIARVKVSLPKQLPSYLPTLQKACIASTFESNPAACPAASVVGVAQSTTPVLPVKLEGPVYFVSHGGEEFPSLIVVLQGDGVRVDLTGSTFIKKGITTSTFKTVPDVPVNSFELSLPQGGNHALAANANLCKAARKLVMPTEFVAQNGTVIRHKTVIRVGGCGKHRAAKKPKAPKKLKVHAH